MVTGVAERVDRLVLSDKAAAERAAAGVGNSAASARGDATSVGTVRFC